jgi:hypothetical protein
MDETFEGYDQGWRLGTFDKCNNVARRVWENLADTTFNELFLDGYNEAYDSNEVRING